MIHKQTWFILVSIEFYTHLSLVCKASTDSTTPVPPNNGDDLTWDFSWSFNSILLIKIKILERWKCEISQTNSYGMFEHMCLIFNEDFIDKNIGVCRILMHKNLLVLSFLGCRDGYTCVIYLFLTALPQLVLETNSSYDAIKSIEDLITLAWLKPYSLPNDMSWYFR